PKIGGFQSFNTARRTIAGFEAMLCLRKGFGLSGSLTINDQNDLLARLFGLQKVNKQFLKLVSLGGTRALPIVSELGRRLPPACCRSLSLSL
ncbi:hypothetical protein ACC695_38700, partial [Rhizobium ruizarguesonis]